LKSLRFPATGGLLTTMLLCGVLVVPAQAASHPRVRLSYAATDIETGQPVVFTYRATGLTRGDRVVFQRPVGTAGHWRSIRKLRARSATITGPTAAQGLRSFRVVVLDRRGHVRATSTRRLRVYAPVALASVANTSTSTVAVGGTVFRYLTDRAEALNGGDECLFFRTCNTGDLLTALSVEHWSCRSLALQLAVVDNTATASPVGVTVVSEAADPSSVTVPVNGVTSLTAPVRGDAQIRYAVQPAADGDAGLYLNGVADCYTASGSTQGSTSS